MAKTKAQLIKAAQALGLETEGLTVAELTALIKEAEAEKAAGSGSTDTTATTEQEETEQEETEEEESKEAAKKAAEALKTHQAANPLVFTDEDGLKYRFKKTAPKTLNVDGAPRSLKDLIANKEVMLELIAGNNNYVERIN